MATILRVTMEECQGHDSVFGEARNVAVRGQRSMDGGTATEMEYKVCQGMEEVRTTLQIDQSSILGLFKAGNHHGSDKLRFFNSLNLTTHSVAIVLFAKFVTRTHTITNASLSVAAPTCDQIQDFVRVHGDSYVTKMVMGAEYYASFTYYAATCEEKMDLLAKMKKDGVFSWGSGDSSFDRKIAKFNSVQNVSMEFHQAMRGISGIALPKPTHLMDFVLKLPTLTVDKPQILQSESVGYEHARGFQVSYFANVMRNRSLIVEDPGFLSLLSQVKGLETDVQAIEAILRQYGMYSSSAGSFLDKVKGALKVDRAAVHAMIQEYKDCVIGDKLPRPTAFKSLKYEERVQASYWTEVQSMYLGGRGGDTRDYVTDIGEFIRSRRRIVSIQLRSDQWIDKIQIKYNNCDYFKCGGSGGWWSNILHVPEGVYFSKIRVKDDGHYITYLEFVLTNGNSLCGGDVKRGGGQDITYEPYTAPEYHYFCGFQARSGMYIDGLRAIFAKLQI